MNIPQFNKMFGTKIEIDQTYMEEKEEERAWKKWQDGAFWTIIYHICDQKFFKNNYKINFPCFRKKCFNKYWTFSEIEANPAIDV